jgi:hypothetical protein
MKTFEYGILASDTDTFFLRKPNRFVLLDVPFLFDSSLRQRAVSVYRHNGRTGKCSRDYQAHRR